MESTTRKRLTVSIPEYAMNDLKKEAALTGWSLSMLAGEYILDAMYDEPNEETKAALAEAMSGKNPNKVYTDVDEMINEILSEEE